MTVTDLAYKVEGRMMRGLFRSFHVRSSSYPYISGDSFRALAQCRFEGEGSLDPLSIRDADIVFVESSRLDRFFEDCLPAIQSRFILISHNGDRNIGPEFASVADDCRIIRWFAQNTAFRHPKIEPVPIGLENRHHHDKGITGDFRSLMRHKRNQALRVLYGFNVSTNHAERGEALAVLRAMALADELPWVNGREYRKRLAGYAFVASPPGNGMDCHRTWEALYLGVLPIVKRSPLFESLDGFPGMVIDDWTEMAAYREEGLRERFIEGSKELASFRPLWMPYWIERIDTARRTIL